MGGRDQSQVKIKFKKFKKVKSVPNDVPKSHNDDTRWQSGPDTWDSVHRVNDQIKKTVVTYRTARQAIGELGGAADLKRFQEIKKSDLKMSGDVVEENRVGQRSSVLLWFWRLDRKAKEFCGDYEK